MWDSEAGKGSWVVGAEFVVMREKRDWEEWKRKTWIWVVTKEFWHIWLRGRSYKRKGKWNPKPNEPKNATKLDPSHHPSSVITLNWVKIELHLTLISPNDKNHVLDPTNYKIELHVDLIYPSSLVHV